MKKWIGILAVFCGFFLLDSTLVFAEQDNYSEDEQSISFRLIPNPNQETTDSTQPVGKQDDLTDGNGTGSIKEENNDKKISDSYGSKVENKQKFYPKTGEMKSMALSFVGTFLIGCGILIAFVKRRKNNDQQEN